MKTKMIVSGLLIVLLSVGVAASASAAPWRGHRHGWYVPAPPMPRVFVPAPRYCPPVPAASYGYGSGYGGGYGRHHHGCRPRYETQRHYGHYDRGYGRGYYR